MSHLPPIPLAFADRATKTQSNDYECHEADGETDLKAFLCGDGVRDRDLGQSVGVEGEVDDGPRCSVFGAARGSGNEVEG